MQSKRRGCGLIMLGCCLLLAAAALSWYNLWDGIRAGQESDTVLQELDTKLAVAEPDTSTVPLYVSHPDLEMPLVEIDGNKYLGRLDIPELGLSLPVMNEWSYPNLKIAPCRYSGSAYQGDLIIAAHNYQEHFGALKKLSLGSQVLFTDMNGNVFTYQVAEIEQLAPTALEEMEAGEWDLTLFTCTVGGSYRVTVRCVAADDSGDL